jgi:hypothetical protein
MLAQHNLDGHLHPLPSLNRVTFLFDVRGLFASHSLLFALSRRSWAWDALAQIQSLLRGLPESQAAAIMVFLGTLPSSSGRCNITRRLTAGTRLAALAWRTRMDSKYRYFFAVSVQESQPYIWTAKTYR